MIFLKQKVLVSRIKIKRKSEQLKIKRKVWNIGCPKDKAPLLVFIVCNENGPRKRWFWFSFIVPNENKTKKETDSVTDDRTTSIWAGSQIRAERPRNRGALGKMSIIAHRPSRRMNRIETSWMPMLEAGGLARLAHDNKTLIRSTAGNRSRFRFRTRSARKTKRRPSCLSNKDFGFIVHNTGRNKTGKRPKWLND